jgi:hypothetical protein
MRVFVCAILGHRVLNADMSKRRFQLSLNPELFQLAKEMQRGAVEKPWPERLTWARYIVFPSARAPGCF